MTASESPWGDRLRQLGTGTRVVVRHRIDLGTGGPRFTDALGVLTAIDATTCTIETRSGEVTIPMRLVVAAKAVPPAPPRRPPRGPTSAG